MGGFLTAQTTIRMVRQGVMPYPRGPYSASVTDYYWNDDRRDIVTYNGIWYAVKKYAPNTPVPRGLYPSSSSAYWTVTSQFEIIITAMMIADAIRTNALNVNDKFKVDTNGNASLVDAYVTGIMHSLGPNTQLIISDGYIRVLWRGEERIRMSVNESRGTPEVYITNNPGTNYATSATITPDGLSFRRQDGKYLTILPQDLGYGNMKQNSDGFLYLDNSTINLVSCYIYASPTAGGTVGPFSGSSLKNYGSSSTVTATPAAGYDFERWSDGGAQSHNVTWVGQTLTAYFKKQSTSTTTYTVSLSASPAAGGTVSGGGIRPEGSTGTITATPASGYMFASWSDDGTQSHTVTWDKTKSLVAYFDQKPTTATELLSGGANCWITEVQGGGSIALSVMVNIQVSATISEYVNGSTYLLHFNRGQLAGKLLRGHRYILTFNAKCDINDSLLTIFFLNNSDLNDNFASEVFSASLTTTITSYALEFTAKRDTTLNDELFIYLGASNNCKFTFTKLSLKEVIE